jgi:hypothetical protein
MRYAAFVLITILTNVFNAVMAVGLVLIAWGVQ